MVSNRLSNVRGAIVALGVFFTLAGQSSWAGTFTWTGASSSNWSVSGNWLNNAVPGGADLAWFARSSYSNQPNLSAAQAAGGLWDTGSAGVALSGAGLTINGTTINGNTSTGIEMDAPAGPLTINSNVTVGSAQTWYNNSGNLLTLGGNVDTGGGTLAVGGSGNTLFSGGVGGSGTLFVTGGSVTMQGSGVVYTGNTAVSGGTLLAYDAFNFSNGSNPANTISIASGGVFQLYTDTSNTVPGSDPFPVNRNQLLGTTNNTTITGNGVFQKLGSGTVGVAANGSGALRGSLTFAMSSGGVFDIEGGEFQNGGWQAVTWTNNQGSLTIGSSGTLDLWDGNTVVVDGLNGAGLVTINGSNGGTHGIIVGVANGSGVFGGVVSNGSATVFLTKSGTGLQTLSGACTYTGITTISGGTLQLGNFGATGALSVSSSIADNGTLAFARSNTVTQGTDFSNAVITGTGNLAQRGAGNLILNLVNVYSGSNTIAGGGTLSVAADNYLGTGSAVTLDNGALAFTAGLTSARNFTVTANGGTVGVAGGNSTISGPITGPGGLYVVSPGTAAMVLTLGNATNSFSGGVTVKNSMLQVASDAMLGAVPSTPATKITLAGGGIYNNGGAITLSGSRNIAVSGVGYLQPGWAPSLFTVNGQISGAGDLGIVWDAGTVVLNGSDTYSGNTIIGAAFASYWQNAAASPTLRLGNALALPPTGSVIFGVEPGFASNTATLDLYGQSPSVLGLAGGTNGIVNNSGGGLSTLTINGSGGLFSGLLEDTKGTLGLVVNVTGVQSLGTGSYVGGTILSGGTLQAGSSTSLGAATNPLQLNGGALDLYGNNITVGQFTGSGGTITSSVGGASVLAINNSLPSTYYGVIVNGAGGKPGLNLASGTLTLPNGSQADGPTSVGGGALLVLGSTAGLGGSVGGAVTLGSGVSGGTLVLGSGNSRVGGLFTGGSSTGNAIYEGYASSFPTLTVNYNGATLDRFSGIIGGSLPNQNNMALAFAGSGQVSLTGVSTYSGSTTISGGTLNLTGGLPNSNVSLLTGGALVGAGNGVTTGVIGGNVTAGSSSIIGLLAGDSATSLTIGGSLTLGGTSSSASGRQTILTYVPGAGGFEQITAGTLNMKLGGAFVNVIPVADGTDHSGNAYASPGVYTLMSYSKTSGVNPATKFSFGTALSAQLSTTAANSRLIYTLSPGATSLLLTVSSVAGSNTIPAVAFFDHQVSNIWDDLSQSKVNWSLDPAGGTLAGMIPGATTDVFLSSTSPASAPMTLGGATTINSLNTNANSSGGQTINGDGISMLTIVARSDSNTYPGGSYSNPAGAGISIAPSSGSLGVNVPVVIAGSQTWRNGSGSLFAVGGNISGTAFVNSTQTLTLSNTSSGATVIGGSIGDGVNGGALAVLVNSVGSGVTTLSGASSYSGGTTVSAGILALGNAGALGSGGLTVSGGSVDLNGTNVSVPTLSGAGGIITNSGSNVAFTIQSGTYGGTITDGAGTVNLVKATSGVLALTGTNTYSGGTTLSGGVLQVSNTANLGNSGSLTFNGGTLQTLGSFSSVRSYLVNANASAAIDTNGNSLTLLGTIAPSSTAATNAGLYKIGLGTLTIANSALLTGPATIDGGTLNLTGTLNSSGPVNVANAAGAVLTVPGTLITTGDMSVSNAASVVGSVSVSAAGKLTTNNLSLANGAGAQATLTNPGNVTATGALSLGNGTSSLGLLTNTGTLTVSGNVTLGNAASAEGTLTNSVILTSSGNVLAGNAAGGMGVVTNSGTLTAAGVTLGNLAGSQGTLTNTGILTTTGNVTLGNAAGAEGLLTNSANVTANALTLGSGSGAVGAFYQTAGNVSTTTGAPVPGTAPGIALGWSTGGYGYYKLGGGAVTTVELQVGSWGPNNNGGNGLFEMSTGTLNDTGWIVMTRSGGTAAYNQTGVLNVFGGLVNYAGGGLAGNWAGGGQTMIVNVSGGTVATTNNTAINLNTGGTAANNTGILNLDGGLVQPSQVIGSGGIVNFNGGLLRASPAANANFLNVAAAYIYPSGGTIDDNGQNTTINTPLLAPTGSGLSSVNATGSGYVSPPIVAVTDSTGSGATAYAVINAAGNLTGIVVSNPGVGYTSPSFTLIGGGGTGSVTGSTLAPNAATGGLTKLGIGTVTLSATDTYGGATAIKAGTLLATQPAALPGYNVAARVTVATGAGLTVESDSGSGWSATSGGDIDALLNHASFAAGSTLGISVTGASPVTYGSNIGAAQANKNFVKSGTGELILNGLNTYTGMTTVSAGTLQFGDGVNSGVPSSTAGWVDNSTLAFNQPGNLQINLPITSNTGGNLYWAGPGKLTLTASNTNLVGGATTVNSGTLQVGLSTTSLTMGQLILNNAALVHPFGTVVVNSALDGALQVGGGTGTAATYTISGGSLLVTGGANMDVGWFGNGTLNQSGGTVTANNYLAIGRQTGSTGNYTITGGVMQQTGSGQKVTLGEQGTGTLTMSGNAQVSSAGGIQVGFGAGYGVGTMNLNGGTLSTVQILGSSNSASTSTVNFNGTYVQAAAGASSSFLSGVTHANVKSGGAVIDTNGNTVYVSQSLVHSGTAAIDGGLTKVGSGALVMTGINTYSGPTVISSGTLQAIGAVLAHRWSFSGSGTTTDTDSVGGITAQLYGSNGTIANGKVTLAGTGSQTDYVDLGNGSYILPSTNSPATIELWATQNAVRNWSRIFDFGSSQTDNLYMSWTQGTNLTSDRVQWDTSITDNTMAPYNLGTEYQIAMVLTPSGTGTYLQWYKILNGAVVSSGNATVGVNLSQMTQSNMTLGRSEYPADSDPNASYDEVRIWNSPLSLSQLLADNIAGPNVVPTASNTLPATTPVRITSADGVLDIYGSPQTIASLSGVPGSTVTNSAYSTTSALTLAPPANSSTTFSGSIQDDTNFGGGVVTLVMNGLGRQVLSGTNSYSGNTNINAGILQFSTPFAMSSAGSVSVATRAVLAVNVGGAADFATTGNAPGSVGGLVAGVGGQGAPVGFSPGAFLGIDATHAGSLTYSDGIADPASGPLGFAVVGGVVTLSGINTYTGGTMVVGGGELIVNNPGEIPGASPDLYVGDYGELATLAYPAPIIPSLAGVHSAAPSAVAPVPEPGTLGLAAAGCVVALLAVRRRKPTGAACHKKDGGR